MDKRQWCILIHKLGKRDEKLNSQKRREKIILYKKTQWWIFTLIMEKRSKQKNYKFLVLILTLNL